MSVERSEARRLNAAIANEIRELIADFTGRGATKSRRSLDQDVVVCELEDGATKSAVTSRSSGVSRDAQCAPSSAARAPSASPPSEAFVLEPAA